MLNKCEHIKKSISILTIFLFASFVLFETYSWGRYAFLMVTAAIFFLGYLERKGNVFFRVDAYTFLYVIFIAYVLLTGLWAKSPSSTITMARTLFRTFICAYLVYLYFVNEGDMSRLLRILMWAGYIVAIYSIMFYGVDELLKAGQDSSLRLDNEFSNVNSIAMCCALSCMIQANEFFKKRNRWTCLFLIPTIIVIAATQSRKALVFMIIGIFSAFIIKNQNESSLKKVLKILYGCIVALLIVYALLQLENFSGIKERMDSLINSFTGNGKADHSAITRERMIEIGWLTFLEHPIGGIGMSNSYFITQEYLGKQTYLHNNFVELLSGGGILAFIFYYAIYGYLFYNLWKYRKADKKQAMFFAIWLLIMLALDYGSVNYYSKDQNFYLMIHFVNIQNLKRKARAKQIENNKICESGKKIHYGSELSISD